MNANSKKIIDDCMQLCQGYVKREAPIVMQLQKVGEAKLYKELRMKNLFTFAVEVCGLSEGTAYSFISVGKAVAKFPALKEAIVTRTLTVSKANRIVSILNSENADELVDFAKHNTSRKIEQEVRKRNPKVVTRAKIKPLNEDTDLLSAPIPRETSEHIERSQSLLAQKTSMHLGLSETIAAVFAEHVERHDPVRKAQRIQKRKPKASRHPEQSEGSPISARAENKRVPLTAEQKRIVDLRDHRKCTFLHNGKRCGDDKWIDYHHIIPVANGGTNDPSKLTTLCSFHHDLVHQLSLPMEGQVTWLRSPRAQYGLAH